MSLLTPASILHPPTGSDQFRGQRALRQWVEDVAAVTRPDAVRWCDGSDAEWTRISDQMVEDGALIRLNPQLRPNSFLARSDPEDVARVEDRTFICSRRSEDAGPTNNWRDPSETRAELLGRFTGAMQGRVMYVIPFSMGAVGGGLSHLGVQISDSPYVVLSTRLMTRMGDEALAAIGDDTPWVPALHTVGAPLASEDGVTVPDVPWPSNSTKIIAHFPETHEIWSYGSGYGGNALLAKKCFALRIASVIGREEGWLAEHMLLIKVTSPAGRAYHAAAAFPSACGKTNFAMLNSTKAGWKVETLGDDIAWLRPGDGGRLWAINPEAGFFGVAPGTGDATNPSAVKTISSNTIFTNAALTEDGDVWWEGLTPEPPTQLWDWQGRPWTPGEGRPAAHPNARFTAPAAQCPTISTDWETPSGVPLDAIIFGGRRTTTVPLVSQARSWAEGVFMGATIASEQTAAAEGPVGKLRFDPFAMLPFCGYNMADHWQHWLDIGQRIDTTRLAIFRVNWFRKNADERFLWPGFGDNVRVLEWIVRRLELDVGGKPTPIGTVPFPQDLDVEGLRLPADVIEELLAFDAPGWLAEADAVQELFDRFGDSVAAPLRGHLDQMRSRVLRILA